MGFEIYDLRTFWGLAIFICGNFFGVKDFGKDFLTKSITQGSHFYVNFIYKHKNWTQSSLLMFFLFFILCGEKRDFLGLCSGLNMDFFGVWF